VKGAQRCDSLDDQAFRRATGDNMKGVGVPSLGSTGLRVLMPPDGRRPDVPLMKLS
jgi:hypothetical protein